MMDIQKSFVHWQTYPTKSSASLNTVKNSNATSQFADVLAKATTTESSGWTVSQHAKQRLAQRGISLSASDFRQMSNAANQAEQKGAKNAFMVVGSDTGLVVHLPSRTVVTAMNQQPDTIVTQIDSVVFVNKQAGPY